jgi:competence protein ComEA
MMVRAFSENVSAPIKSFLLKLGVLALGIGWVSFVGWPSQPEPVALVKFPEPSSEISVLPRESLLPIALQTLPPSVGPANIRAQSLPGELANSQPGERESLKGSAPLDVNGATQGELEQLPGLGAVLAERIVAYRQANGPFHRVEELERVRGIGHKRLQQLRPLIRMSTGKT